MQEKLDVAILGATGAVGQRFVQLLEKHPWFRVGEVIGSSRSSGHHYGKIANWVLDGTPPAEVANLKVKGLTDPLDSKLVFSALPKEVAIDREPELAKAGHIVCTNASAHRMQDDVPLLLPEVNANHIRIIDYQREKRGWTGALIANSNCTTMPVVMSLAPLLQFGVKRLLMVSEQAISGAGYPGISSLDILDNVIPFVSGDESKMETETQKMLGEFKGNYISPYTFSASATCTRVPVIDGHLVNMSVELQASPDVEEIIETWENFRGPKIVYDLPSAPEKPIIYLPQQDRPQIRRDRNNGQGMATSVGRIRECAVLGYKYAALTHNTIRGAAGCSILNAELAAAHGYIANFQPSIG